jgi:hypothetical protein
VNATTNPATSANVEAAKAIRAEVRAMAKTDPRLSGAKVSVTAGHASLMSEVNVRVTDFRDGSPPDCGDEGAKALARDLWVSIERHWREDGRTRFSGVAINGRSF